MHRLRWDNIARAAVVPAVVALVVAWPHLKGAPPSLPPAAATPVSVEQAAAPHAPRPPRHTPRPRPRPPVHRPRPPHVHRPAPRRAPVVVAPSPPPSRPTAPAPAPAPASPAPSAGDLAAHEFAVP